MNAQRFNKASAAAIAGATVTIISSVWPVGPEFQGAAQTLLTAFFVYYVANKG